MKKVLTFGVYDYYHLGHLRLFKQCRQYGDYLIVAVQDSEYITRFKPGAKNLYTTEERVEMVSSVRIVDEVIVYQAASISFVENLDFDVLALGEDQTQDHFNEVARWCEENGKQVVRLKRTQGISSSDIKNNIK